MKGNLKGLRNKTAIFVRKPNFSKAAAAGELTGFFKGKIKGIGGMAVAVDHNTAAASINLPQKKSGRIGGGSVSL